MLRLYFAASITGGREDAPLYEAIVAGLGALGQVLTQHVGSPSLTAAGETGLSARQIHDRDLAWLLQADAVIAEVTTPSLGVGYEIGVATRQGIPVLALFRPGCGRRLSGMIGGSPGVEVLEYDAAHLPDLFARLERRLNR